MGLLLSVSSSLSIQLSLLSLSLRGTLKLSYCPMTPTNNPSSAFSNPSRSIVPSLSNQSPTGLSNSFSAWWMRTLPLLEDWT